MGKAYKTFFTDACFDAGDAKSKLEVDGAGPTAAKGDITINGQPVIIGSGVHPFIVDPTKS